MKIFSVDKGEKNVRVFKTNEESMIAKIWCRILHYSLKSKGTSIK